MNTRSLIPGAVLADVHRLRNTNGCAGSARRNKKCSCRRLGNHMLHVTSRLLSTGVIAAVDSAPYGPIFSGSRPMHDIS